MTRPAPTPAQPRLASGSSDVERFAALLGESLARRRFVKLVLANYRGSEPGLQRVSAREIGLRGERHLSLLYRHATRDITKNLTLDEAVPAVLLLLDDARGRGFGHAHLETLDEQADLRISKKGKPSLSRRLGPVPASAGSAEAAPCASTATPAGDHAVQPQHDRNKHRLLGLADPCWHDLGLTDAQGRLIPAMSRKWKQINKFVEVLDAAWRESALPLRGADAPPVRVMDFGAGKGYLTFAVHAHLSGMLQVATDIQGIELRSDLVELCNRSAQAHRLAGLRFVEGDVMHQSPQALDIMIALHACDTATDHAIHKGIVAGAQIILCSPCCHKQLRPQLRSPGLLRPMLQHGIHLGQQAEMITDSLRALLLEAHGYQTRVFEFVALEHTSKNKMILAVKRRQCVDGDAATDAVHAQIRAIKDFYGVREHCLEVLLSGAAGATGSRSRTDEASPPR